MSEKVLGLAALALAGLLLVVFSPADAYAQDGRKARAHARQAKAFFDAGNFVRAAEEYQAAHDLDHRPSRLYNIAVCHERRGDRAQALKMYRRYLEMDPDGAGAQVAAEAVAALERDLATGELPQRGHEGLPPGPQQRAADVVTSAAISLRAQARAQRGDELTRSGQHAAAAAEFVAAYEMDSSRPVRLWWAAEAYRQAGDAGRAADHYRRYLASVVIGEHALEARLWLEELTGAGPGARAAGAPVPAAGLAADARERTKGGTRRHPALLVLAGVAVASGVALDLVPGSASNGRFDGMDVAPLGCYAIGLILATSWVF